LGLAYKNQDKLKEAITAWSKIRPEAAGSETYAWAQLNLGLAYKSLGKLEQAITVLSKIRREEADPETYVEAQLGLGEVYSLDKEKEEKAHDAYDNVRDFSYYKSERGFKILNCPLEVRKDLHSLSKNTDEVLKSLQIIPEFESKVAHYSRSSTAFDLFKSKKNEQELSKFRLNTIRGVNDPTEGLVLSNYWDQQGIPETTHTNDTATFISCFTFNHDSLNQFRLYGKEDGREATGVSLVFKKEFFSKHSGALKYIAGASSDPSNNSGENESDEAGKLESDNKKKIISKSTLYRCIYLDPETGYWTLAQRDKSTFYRHYKEKAEKKWKTYYMLILIKEKKVEKHLFNKENNDNDSVSSKNNKIKSISQVLNLIFTDKNHIYNECDKDKKQKILEVIRFILLPLQYLVKHIAFQEEQECRIMYTTHLHDEKIHHDWEKQQMYVEYKEQVLPHIDKIWLSPGAAKYQDHFRILLDQGSGKSKVRISQNPFRNKE
ncbi:tetratricopeptide repeat protein, partial [Rothia dentocariosa]|uniref:tetratricopeptide repeat protein n=1 Tax=Rothia dentocariosa TaxID=2047 RepID=UPI003C72B77C